MCMCTKGATDMSLCFTDISPAAGWRTTFLQQVPWQTEPNYVHLYGFDLLMIVPDLLHCFNLGVSRDMLGCILKLVLQNQDVFGGGDLATRLKTATDSLRAFARANKHVLKLKKITKNKLTWSGKKYPELKVSGSDAHVIGVWLEQVLQPFQQTYGEFCALLWSSNRCMRLLYKGIFFLTPAEKNTAATLWNIYASTFLRLAREAVENHKLLWRVRPKMHLIQHLMDWPRMVNPSMYSCWMDEDWLRKISRTLKLSAVATAQKRVLQRWLMAIPFNLENMLR